MQITIQKASAVKTGNKNLAVQVNRNPSKE